MCLEAHRFEFSELSVGLSFNLRALTQHQLQKRQVVVMEMVVEMEMVMVMEMVMEIEMELGRRWCVGYESNRLLESLHQ